MERLQDYYRDRVSPEAYDLFAVFSRFEYAMKKGGFRQARKPDASWRRFGDLMPDEFFRRMRAAPETEVYFQKPPDHLVCNGDSVDWSRNPNIPCNASELFMCIKTARNNLFHGDKRHGVRRDRELMIAALFILNSAYEVAESCDAFSSFCAEMEYGL